MSSDIVMLKQMAIRKMVVDFAVPEKTIEAVIAHAFKGAHKAFSQCSSIEISGFGKFTTRPTVLLREKTKYYGQLEKWNKELIDLTDEKQIAKRHMWIARVNEYLNVIKKIEHEV